MYNKNDWDKRTKSDFEYLNSLGYEVLGVFMVGSQNYELDIENSDIDTKAIVIPKINDIVLNKQPESRLIVLENSEHIEVKDIREMFKCLLKQNINFLEILFSKNHPTFPTTIPTPYISPTIDTIPMCNENNDFTKGLKDFYRKWGDIPKDV